VPAPDGLSALERLRTLLDLHEIDQVHAAGQGIAHTTKPMQAFLEPEISEALSLPARRPRRATDSYAWSTTIQSADDSVQVPAAQRLCVG
jgi:hypothetical protein